MTCTSAATRARRRGYARAFNEKHPGYHLASVKKWKKSHPAAWAALKAAYYKRHSQGATNGYSHWTPDETELLLQHSIPDVELARSLKRTLRAVCVKRARLKRLGITSPVEVL